MKSNLTKVIDFAKKVIGKNNEVIYENPYCTCIFATKSDLKRHIEAWGNEKREHVRRLDKAHREYDRSFRGTLAKRKGKSARYCLNSSSQRRSESDTET